MSKSYYFIPTEQLTGKAPGGVLQRLYVLNVNDQHITRLCSLDLERSGEVVDLGQIDVADIVCRIIVLDLTSSPVYTFDLDCLAILDRSCKGNC